MTTEARAYSQTLGEEGSIWFKISPFVNASDPMGILNRLCASQGGCVPAKTNEFIPFFHKGARHGEYGIGRDL